ncbi:response regulator transcription factor [Cohnella fermenti]|uniref:Helix-turn-helix domain-containing protein n=1 Tax=Cohnella fermenti TaxID=2565925 RepID=A0A4S4C5V7_9BACL|nr:helix-turn-helix domain-containing protein [Cohnella fermenti]THF83242.1 helix-turn-helix domain-containing protein [Cohnella fermenti]
MYKVFLVDDEELVIKSLIKSVNWGHYGFEVVGYALSGNDAFEAIGHVKPSIVFTDIRMPGMSGLELIKNLKDAGDSALHIVISGYAEFAFAQKAMNYGAFGYCLKPFDEAEISAFLIKAKAILEKREPSDRIELIDLLEEDDERSGRALEQALQSAGIDIGSEQGLGIAVSIGPSKLRLDDWRSCIIVRMGFAKYAYLLRMGDLRRLLTGLQESDLEGIKGLGYGEAIHRVDRIRDAVHVAEILAYRYFTTGDRVSAQTEEDQERTYAIKKLEEALNREDGGLIHKWFDELGSLFASGQLNIKHALIVYHLVHSFCYRHEEEVYEDFVYSFDRLARLYGTVRDMMQELKGMLEEKLAGAQERVVSKAQNRTFKPIIHYINEHYREDISIPAMSRMFNINANYMSQLFKKEAGMTFTEYVTSLRLEHACKLLTATDDPINEIAERSGYDDYFYFSRIFKKIKGITPSAYRTGR